jgi:hypothetical protein
VNWIELLQDRVKFSAGVKPQVAEKQLLQQYLVAWRQVINSSGDCITLEIHTPDLRCIKQIFDL